MDLNDLRAAFELWAVAEGYDITRSMDRENYLHINTMLVWSAWLACHDEMCLYFDCSKHAGPVY